MKMPLCIITGDIHYGLQTIELADSAVRQAIQLANELNIPLVLNGDTLDTKSIIRGEVANRLIDTLQGIEPQHVYINTGNHDMLNHHGTESSLNFLRPYAQVIASPTYVPALNSTVIPYFHNNAALQTVLDGIKAGSQIIVHSGVLGADMGAYMKDPSSLPPESFENFRTLGSHFHRRQDIKCGRPRRNGVGLFSFCGSAYSVTFAEAFDGPKGINILYSDGSLELVPTNLRKHVKLELNVRDLKTYLQLEEFPNPEDIVWMCLSGPESELAKVSKVELTRQMGLSRMKLDKLPDQVTELDSPAEDLNDMEIYDKLVDQGTESSKQKVYLKELARELLQEEAS